MPERAGQALPEKGRDDSGPTDAGVPVSGSTSARRPGPTFPHDSSRDSSRSHGTRGQSGRVFDIQRFAIHDGPGIRTTVFLQGCPLRCVWCHNPEGQPIGTLLSFQPDRCVGCGWCVEACPRHAHEFDSITGEHILARDRCVVCGRCVEQCYSQALELVGGFRSVDEAMAEVLEDVPFYRTSGGGLTLSGGEPLLQIDFAAALLRAAREHRIHCAVETCGAVPFSHFERVLSLVELFLFDVKDTSPEHHRRFTGADNAPILANLRRLYAADAAIRLRLPLIPRHNDRDDHFDGIAALVHEMPGLKGVEIMPYHRLGTSKLARFGWSGGLDIEPPDRATIRRWVRALQERGVHLLSPPSTIIAPKHSAP